VPRPALTWAATWPGFTARSAIKLRDRTWPTREHFFEAQKFEDAEDQEEVRKARTFMLAARMGRDRKHRLRRDWESTKVSVMREAVRAKFTQHADLTPSCSTPVMRSSSSTPNRMTTGVMAETAAGRTSSAAS
jgi:ribA/ribD-fused uncharacterized protein